jgi:hypothetical protein
MIGPAAERQIVSQRKYLIIDTLVPSVRIAAACRYVEHVPEIGGCRCGGMHMCRFSQHHELDVPSAITTVGCLTTDCDMTAVDTRGSDSGRGRQSNMGGCTKPCVRCLPYVRSISDCMMARYQFEKSPNVRQHNVRVSTICLPRTRWISGDWGFLGGISQHVSLEHLAVSEPVLDLSSNILAASILCVRKAVFWMKRFVGVT